MEPTTHEEHATYRLGKNRFILMIVGCVVLTFGFVAVAMMLYSISGAAQVDLSRPGYSGVRDQVVSEKGLGNAFPASGPVNSETLKQFRALFDTTADQIRATESFSGEQLSDQALGIAQ